MDQVHAQVRLLDHLGIHQVHAAIGASLGGVLCLTLAMRYPERVNRVLPMATGARITPLQHIHNFEQVFAIESDPAFANGDYDPATPPDVRRRLESLYPGCQVHLFVGAGHSTAVTHQDEYLAVIDGFLSQK